MTEWFYRNGDEQEHGPIGAKALLELIHQGEVVEQTFLRKDDSQWVQAIEVNGLWEAARRPTLEYLCPQCHRVVDPPPCRCKRCDMPVTRAIERYVFHEASGRERRGILGNLLHRRATEQPDPSEPIRNELDDPKPNENWAKWVGDLLQNKNSRKSQRPPDQVAS